ncbi:MAG TPA: restriction endonuclease subunit S [Candidatus Nanoarchaeia archaeon]
MKKLGEVAEYINGYPFSPDDWKSQGLPIIRIQNLNDSSKEYNYFAGEVDEKYLVKPGDILISWSASLGVYIWQNSPAWLNQHIFKVLVNEKIVDKDFFFYTAQTKIDEMKTKVHGGTMQHITKGEFENIEISMPEVTIQKKIVERLDAIRKAQELNDLQISKTEELFNVLLNSEINVNEGEKVLGGYIKLSSGKFKPSKDHDPDGKIPVYGGNGVNGFTTKPLIENPTIAIGRVGAYCGVAYLVKEPSWVTDNAIFIKEYKKEEINLEYLYFFLLRFDLHQFAGFSGQPKITQEPILKIKFNLPRLEEQKNIVEKLSAVQEHKKLLLKQKSLLRELFDSALNKCMKEGLYK